MDDMPSLAGHDRIRFERHCWASDAFTKAFTEMREAMVAAEKATFIKHRHWQKASEKANEISELLEKWNPGRYGEDDQ